MLGSIAINRDDKSIDSYVNTTFIGLDISAHFIFGGPLKIGFNIPWSSS